jgi:D-alanyl-D-alanine carboxypeptidase
MYDGAFGIKTGFTKASGRCLVTAAERNGVTLVAVTLNAPDDWNDHIRMMDYAFGRVKVHTISVDCPYIDVVGSQRRRISTHTLSNINIPYVDVIPQYTVSFYTDRFVYAGVKVNDYIGYVEVSFSDKIIVREYILSSEEATIYVPESSDITFLEKVKKFLRKGLS